MKIATWLVFRCEISILIVSAVHFILQLVSLFFRTMFSIQLIESVRPIELAK